MRPVNGFSFMLEKNDVVIWTKKRIPMLRALIINEMTIELKPKTKYLRLSLYSKVSFFEQIETTMDKAMARVSVLSWLMENVGDPTSTIERSPFFSTKQDGRGGTTVRKEICCNRSVSLKYKMRALRVGFTYRIVSQPVVMVIAEVIHITLIGKERTKGRRVASQEAPRKLTFMAERVKFITTLPSL